MKTEQAIRINKARAQQPAGGAWETLDPVSRGKVQVLELTAGQEEAAAVVAELQRLNSLKPDLDWSDCAVLARTREALQPIRAACEHLRIPVIWGLEGDRLPRLSRIREIARFLDVWDARRDRDCHASELVQSLGEITVETNVWEWCQDWWAVNYYGASPLADPPGAPGASNRVLRGGSWYYDASYCRASSRIWNVPGYRYGYLGFRLARTVSSLPR